MPEVQPNPFKVTREARAHVITVRLTPSEFKAVEAVAGPDKGAKAELIREGLGMAVEARRKAKR
jgi:hypothetical protein